MPAANHKGDYWWPRWEGSVADIAEVARLALSLVAARTEATVAITVSARTVDTDYVVVDEFENYTGSEIAAVNSITVLACDREGADRIHLRFAEGWPVVQVSVSGPDRTFVLGAAQRIRETINELRRRPKFKPERLGRAAGAAVGAAIMALAALAVFRVYADWGFRLLNLLLAIPVAASMAFMVATWVAARFPKFELIPTDGQTVWERVRRKVIGGGLALGGLIVAAVVATLVNRIFGN